MSKILKNKMVQMGLVFLVCLVIYDIATALYVKNYVNDKGEETSGFSGFSGGLSKAS